MADTTTLKLKDGTTISGYPTELLNDDAHGKTIAQLARSISGPGSTSEYAKLSSIANSRSMGIAGMGETPPSPSQEAPLPSDAPEVDPPLPADEAPKTTFKGVVSSFLREAGPNIAAGATGFALGGPVGAAVGVMGTEVTEMVTPHITNFINEKLGKNEVSFGEIESIVADALGLEKADTDAERLASAAGRGTAEAMGVLAGGQLLAGSPSLGGPQTTGQRVGQKLMEQPVQQAAGGTLSAIGAEKGAQIAEEKDYGPVGSVLLPLGLGIAGDIAGTGLVNASEKVNKYLVAKGIDLPESAAEAIRLSQGRGEVYLSDFDETPTLRETLAWSPKDQSKRNLQRRQVIYDAMDDMGIVDQDYYNRDIINDFNRKRGDLLSQWTDAKKEVIERLSHGGMDAPEGGIPVEDAVPIPETLELIQKEAANLSALGDDSLQPLIRTLDNWGNSLDNKNLVQVEFLRKRLRNQFEDPGLASVKDDGDKLAKKVYDSLNKEMGDYISSEGTPEDFSQWKIANTALADMTGDFQVDSLSTMIKKGTNNPDVVNRFLNSGSKEQLENLYDNLSVDGRKTVQSAIMTDMIKQSTDLGDLSPNQFARLMERSPATGVFFDEAEKAQLDGLQKWLEATKKAEVPSKPMDISSQLPGERYAVSRGLWNDPRIGLPVAIASKAGGKKIAQWMERGDVRDNLIKYAAVPDKDVDGAAEFTKRLWESYSAFMGAEESPDRITKPLMED